MLVAVVTFALAAVLIVLLPGPDTLVMLRSIVRGGRSRGIATACGVLTGLAIWVSGAALGISALLRASHLGYDALRIAGAVYLVWLGVSSLLLRRSATSPASDRPPRRGLLGTGFVSGLLTDLLNPKVGVFFISFLPGFVPHGASVGWTTLLFGAIFIVETALYCALLLALAGRVTAWMNRPRTRRRLDAITGSVLIAFGIRLALEP
ncbi:MAG TPA: LysE family translocator [Jatrophihabitantaceae bacterium]|jgi:threonine/homoserine/homoserine lactone efflux protein|nr:LysE family translocator [Jatrophihabitantaceae bacterium]